MKFVLTGGGTGGHVYPALAIAESLKARYDTAEFLYIGVRGRAEEKIVPSNRLEPLKGKRKGQHSMRINDQWRICFQWRKEDVFDVEIVDYQ